MTHQFLTIETLDKIPPLCLSFLTEFSPLIQYAAAFVDILEWKDTSKSTFTVLLWLTICLWTNIWLIFGVPLLYITRVTMSWLHTQVTRRKRQEKEKLISKTQNFKFENDVSRGLLAQNISIEQTLYHLNRIQVWWKRYKQYSLFFKISHENSNWVALTSTMIYIWPIWALFNRLAGSRLVLMLLGSLFLVESASWFKISVMAFKRNPVFRSVAHALWSYNVAILSYVTGLRFKKLKSIPNNEDTSKQDHLPEASLLSCHETYRCEIPVIIEVYENQRWWLGLDWTTSLLASERKPWTDNQLQPIESKECYSLPKVSFSVKTSCEKDTVIKKTTIKSWVWTDHDWWIDMTGELESKVDLNGWQYGNNSWDHFSSVTSPHTFTRQRRWCKRARLIERQISEQEVDKKNQ
ncbi:hypothetical protein K501DRAFT_280165 [Backusella circina FSU 941]|nr:hypothetical protein K501DRAFT_280165 [Backusella circina FSU 941]